MSARLLALLLFAPALPDSSAKELRAVQAATARNLMFVPARVGNLPVASFVVDTGATQTIIDSRLVREAKLPVGRVEYSGSAGDDRCPISVIDAAVTIASTRVSAVHGADLSALEAFSGTAIDGIAGQALFERNVVTFDFTSRQVNLRAPEHFRAEARDALVPLLGAPRPCCAVAAELRFRGKKAGSTLLIDTGAAGFELILAAPFARRLALVDSDLGATIQVPGLCARSRMVRLRAPIELHLPGLPPVAAHGFASLDSSGVLASGDIDGVIGSELLRQLGTVTVDWPGRRILVRR